MDLVVKIYAHTATLPREEMFGLKSQMRRCAVSIPSNIAEGAARSSPREYRRFLSIARGSLNELDAQLDVCVLLDLMSTAKRDALDDLLIRIDKMIHFLRLSKAKERESNKQY